VLLGSSQGGILAMAVAAHSRHLALVAAHELLMLEVDRHLLLNECVELVTGPLVDRIRRLVAVPTTAEKGGRDEPRPTDHEAGWAARAWMAKRVVATSTAPGAGGHGWPLGAVR
jgi:hypothetical protein